MLSRILTASAVASVLALGGVNGVWAMEDVSFEDDAVVVEDAGIGAEITLEDVKMVPGWRVEAIPVPAGGLQWDPVQLWAKTRQHVQKDEYLEEDVSAGLKNREPGSLAAWNADEIVAQTTAPLHLQGSTESGKKEGETTTLYAVRATGTFKAEVDAVHEFRVVSQHGLVDVRSDPSKPGRINDGHKLISLKVGGQQAWGGAGAKKRKSDSHVYGGGVFLVSEPVRLSPGEYSIEFDAAPHIDWNHEAKQRYQFRVEYRVPGLTDWQNVATQMTSEGAISTTEEVVDIASYKAERAGMLGDVCTNSLASDDYVNAFDVTGDPQAQDLGKCSLTTFSFSFEAEKAGNYFVMPAEKTGACYVSLSARDPQTGANDLILPAPEFQDINFPGVYTGYQNTYGHITASEPGSIEVEGRASCWAKNGGELAIQIKTPSANRFLPAVVAQ